jgi:hypothetical protein
MKIRSLIFSAIVLPLSAQAQIAVWMSPNDVESASAPSANISGVATETFTINGGNPFGTNPSGLLANGATYSNTGSGTGNGTAFLSNGTFGGAATGTYLNGKSGSNTILSLSTPAAYFGIYFLAADAFNDIVISSLGTTLLTFNTQTLLTKLNGGVGTVQAINGSIYNTADYFGKPGSPGTNPTQAYAYLHFIAEAGVTFDKIELKQRVGAASFESDNHSIRATAPTTPGSLVAVPEPSSLLLSLSTLGTLMLVRKRK